MSLCVVCNKPLEVEVDYDSDSDQSPSSSGPSSSGKAPAAAPETVPDDVQLSCGCHFHWDCLLTAYTVTQCPSCSANIATPDSQRVLVTLHNEGGLQQDLDILPLLIEESYLKAYPADRKARAFLEFCREGDYQAVVSMLQDDEVESDEEDEDEDEQMADDDNEEEGVEIGTDALLRYQDPIGDMQSGLHAAVHAQSREVAWLLLLLASNLDLAEFPPQVFQEAASLGIMRGLTEDKVDIRSLRDGEGRTAEDVAREVGGVWVEWIGSGRLAL